MDASESPFLRTIADGLDAAGEQILRETQAMLHRELDPLRLRIASVEKRVERVESAIAPRPSNRRHPPVIRAGLALTPEVIAAMEREAADGDLDLFAWCQELNCSEMELRRAVDRYRAMAG